MGTVRGAARFALVIGVYVVCALFIVFFVFPFSSKERRGRIIGSWSRRFLRWAGVMVHVEGYRAPDPEVYDSGITEGMGRLVVSNHISFLDIFTLNSVMPCSFVAKAEIAKWPVFGTITAAVNTIFIERGNKRKLLAITDNIEKALGEGRSVLVFPEGTTSDGTGLQRLHSNLFEAGVRSGAEVLPVVLRYTSGGEICIKAAYKNIGLFPCLWNILKMSDLTVTVKMLEPVRGKDRRELCRNASAVMSAAVGVPDPLDGLDA